MLCGATVARTPVKREVVGSIPTRAAECGCSSIWLERHVANVEVASSILAIRTVTDAE
jgi:hypothetical protein